LQGMAGLSSFDNRGTDGTTSCPADTINRSDSCSGVM